jgi:hypothetical protein
MRIAFVLLLAACGGSQAKPAPEPAPKQHTAAELGPLCDRYYVRQRSCVNEYLHALVAMRAEYDMPKGIADEVKADGLDATVAKAKPEWERDTTPEKTAAICKQMAEHTPADRVDGLLADGENCMAMAECDAFAKCAVETERTYVKEGMQH